MHYHEYSYSLKKYVTLKANEPLVGTLPTQQNNSSYGDSRHS